MASVRKELGKSAVKKIRNAGLLPAVLYGRETEAVSLTLSIADLKAALSTEAGENTLLELRVRGEAGEITKLALLRSTQFNYLTSKPIHFDFQEVSMREKLTVKIPIKITGKAPGVKEGGILEEIHREIEIECFPTDIPNSIEVDISSLGIGDSIHVRDLAVSDKITLLLDADETVITVLSTKPEDEAKAAGETPAGAEVKSDK
ncbi:MAG: 50S ribosomal protein L25 [Deltaproteobacteria bacterium]